MRYDGGRALLKTAVAVLLPFLPCPLLACSAVSCINGGPEFRRDFTVVLKHEGKPLQGASVEVTYNTERSVAVRFYGVAGSDGTVRITGLAPGEYWLNAELLGISAAYHCFHVSQRTSGNAKHRMTYKWGNFAVATRRVAGTLMDSQPGTGGTPVWNLVHRLSLPISGSKLILQNPFTGAVFSANSDRAGAFAFDDIPSGLYVLHVEGGRSNRDFDTADKLVRITPTAKGDTLLLTKSDPGGGSCGGTILELATK